MDLEFHDRTGGVASIALLVDNILELCDQMFKLVSLFVDGVALCIVAAYKL